LRAESDADGVETPFGGPVRIVLLEDRPEDVELSRQGLEASWDVVDNEEAFVAALRRRPDIILADYTLPAFDALMAITRLKESELDIPMIVLSGSVGEEKAVRALRAGAADYLLKDRLGRLVPAIIRALAERKLVQEHRAYMHALEHQALHDTLTGLPNRALFLDRLRRGLVAARRDRARVSMLLLGINRFRELNDSLGHTAGDELLRQVASRLQGSLRAADTVARLGGDQFAVLPYGARSGDQMGGVANKLLSAFAAPFRVGGEPIYMGASAGAAVHPDDGGDAGSLLRSAEVAMYAAKRQGLGLLTYNPDLDVFSVERLALMAQLREGIERGELLLHYQPKVDLQSGVATGAEALLRWRHPVRGLVPPGEFIDAAEEDDVIHPLTRWVLGESLAQSSRWQEEGLTVHLHINLSARNLAQPGLIQELRVLLDRHGVPSSQITFEITERNIVDLRARDMLSELRNSGFGISVDDFGSGYSALGYLRDMPVTEIKIDRSFVNAMDSDGGAIVAPVIQMAHNLGLAVVGEGVERAETAERLRSFGCDSGQGYHFARPMEATALEDWLAARSTREVATA
jgi:diguanylate cyclase (GGDEF)-like protein